MCCVELCGGVHTAPKPKTRHTVTDANGFQTHFVSLVHFTGLAPLLVSMSGSVNTPLQQESIPVGFIPPAFVVPWRRGVGYLWVLCPRGVGLPSHPRRDMSPEIPYPLPYRKEHGTRDTLTPPSVDRHTCENITFLQLCWRAVMNSR